MAALGQTKSAQSPAKTRRLKRNTSDASKLEPVRSCRIQYRLLRKSRAGHVWRLDRANAFSQRPPFVGGLTNLPNVSIEHRFPDVAPKAHRYGKAKDNTTISI